VHDTTLPIVFDCNGSQLVGMLHRPADPACRGVLIVVGGPQYRIGSHRQFVLLARDLAAAGFAVMRFDYRGIGDSSGNTRNFEHINADIDAALKAFHAACPEMRDIVIWGLCDAASAALFYISQPRHQLATLVTGLVLLNPWVRTEQGHAKSYLTNYYGRRILQKELWSKLLSGQVALGDSLRSFVRKLCRAFMASDTVKEQSDPSAALPERMRQAFSGYAGRTLFIISGNDLTAAEFEQQARRPEWRTALTRSSVQREYLPDSDHTFSRREWRDRVTQLSIDWLRSW
jgi:exosortase A-associated hydrolase 1